MSQIDINNFPPQVIDDMTQGFNRAFEQKDLGSLEAPVTVIGAAKRAVDNYKKHRLGGPPVPEPRDLFPVIIKDWEDELNPKGLDIGGVPPPVFWQHVAEVARTLLIRGQNPDY